MKRARPNYPIRDLFCLWMFLLVFPSLLLLFPARVFGQRVLPDSITAQWMKYNKPGNDSAKVLRLFRLAFLYDDYLEDKKMSDSLAESAVKIAEQTLRTDLIVMAYNMYLESTDNEVFYEKSLLYANKALQYCRISNNLAMLWRTYRNLVRVYLSHFKYNDAMASSNDALLAANSLRNDTLIAETYLYIGKSYAYKNQKIEAFRSFLLTKDLAEKIGDAALNQKFYAELFTFYNDNRFFDDAIECKRMEGMSILARKPVDSVALKWIQYDLQLVDLRQMSQGLTERGVSEIIDFALRTHNLRLKNWEFALYRTYLMKKDDVSGLQNFYTVRYPGEFASLSKTNREMYFRLTAYFKELNKDPDSADFYFRKAEKLVVGNPDKSKAYQSTFLNRYGQFLARQGRFRMAIEKFTLSYNICLDYSYFGKMEYMLTASRQLEKLYRQVGDYRNAWYYAMANLKISDSIAAITKKDQLMAEDVKRERQKKELEMLQDKQQIRQGKTQRDMMAGGAVFFVIVSLLIYRNFRNQKRLNRLLDESKRKSDELLLNILPQETAEELRTTGTAKAKRFEEVTVMFTDFKDFTQASELMSAEELVNEINFYFSEFDRIISQHNIEKIKIIGDSYMCAGGLPVPNATHACDVVEAALELQEFMITQKIERSGRGAPFFELRIGIHTGPVVAGIVGIKKFAYDIWGDTVNTASRMENCGEPNRVNISGETYERIKNRFKCIHRGKVKAKHKGEIDMYFVGLNTP
jgi:class 3 adenylate cyclase